LRLRLAQIEAGAVTLDRIEGAQMPERVDQAAPAVVIAEVASQPVPAVVEKFTEQI
jgi:hypothetical protein